MAKRGKRNCVLGIDLGSYAVKAVEMTRRGGELFVTGYAYEPVAIPGNYAEAVRAAIASGGLRAGRVAAAVSGAGTVVQCVSVPVSGEGDLRRSLVLETERAARADLSESLFDYHIVEEGDSSRTAAVTASARREEIDARLAILEEAGVVPDIVDAELVALANACETAGADDPRRADGRGVVCVDFGAAKTLIAACRGGARLFRETPLGGAGMTDMVARRLGVDLDEAERVKCSPGDRMEVVKDAIYPGIEELAAEVRAVRESLGEAWGKEPGLLLASGGLAAFPGAVRVMGRLARMEAGVFNSFGSVAVDEYDREFFRAYAHVFPVAFGLACHARS